jgi:hypothetical protein
MTALLQDPRTIIALITAVLAVGGILAQIKFLRSDVTDLQKMLKNGISTEIKSISVAVSAIQATCAERARHVHACERE